MALLNILKDPRRAVAKKARDKVIVFKEDRYGILYTQEMAILLGAKIKEPSKGVGKTKEEILKKYEKNRIPEVRPP